MALIVPAVLPSSYKDLEDKLDLLIKIPSVTRIQIDIVDGIFASPASWPYFAPQELEAMVKKGRMLPALDRVEYEIDMMCIDAERAIDSWLAIGASRVTFHIESTTNLPKLVASSRRRYGNGGLVPRLISFGCAINIGSDISLLESCVNKIEYVQFMGISRIGRQGQIFDKRVFEKIKLFRNQHHEVFLQVDGGVSLGNARELVKLGVSDLIVGSAIMRAKDPSEIIAKFESLQTPYGV
jgi:ribulose-phosphate 3-epimerase